MSCTHNTRIEQINSENKHYLECLTEITLSFLAIEAILNAMCALPSISVVPSENTSSDAAIPETLARKNERLRLYIRHCQRIADHLSDEVINLIDDLSQII